jgi:Transglycosylase SLT domain
MRRPLYGSPTAASLAITVALTASAFAADSPASPSLRSAGRTAGGRPTPPVNPPAAGRPPATRPAHTAAADCTSHYSVAQHRRYARRVFHRIHISGHARRRLATLRACQTHPGRARPAVHRTERRLKHERSLYLCTQSRVVNCIRDATRIYGGDFHHNLACATSESGLNPYARNASGSSAAGIFQFLPSTFAVTLARMHVGSKSIYSAKWNSRAAAWKFVHDGYGEWTGAGC